MGYGKSVGLRKSAMIFVITSNMVNLKGKAK